MGDAVIVGAVRTAVGRKGGKLSSIRPDDLAALVLKDLITRVKVDPAEIEDVILGCVDQLGEQGFNIARNAALIAGLPVDVGGTTLDRMCGSRKSTRLNSSHDQISYAVFCLKKKKK